MPTVTYRHRARTYRHRSLISLLQPQMPTVTYRRHARTYRHRSLISLLQPQMPTVTYRHRTRTYRSLLPYLTFAATDTDSHIQTPYPNIQTAPLSHFCSRRCRQSHTDTIPEHTDSSLISLLQSQTPTVTYRHRTRTYRPLPYLTSAATDADSQIQTPYPNIQTAPLSHFCSHRRRQSHTDTVPEHTDRSLISLLQPQMPTVTCRHRTRTYRHHSLISLLQPQTPTVTYRHRTRTYRPLPYLTSAAADADSHIQTPYPNIQTPYPNIQTPLPYLTSAATDADSHIQTPYKNIQTTPLSRFCSHRRRQSHTDTVPEHTDRSLISLLQPQMPTVTYRHRTRTYRPLPCLTSAATDADSHIQTPYKNIQTAPLSHFCSHRRRQSHTDTVPEHTDRPLISLLQPQTPKVTYRRRTRTYRLTVAPLSHFCSHRRRQSHTDTVPEHTDRPLISLLQPQTPTATYRHRSLISLLQPQTPTVTYRRRTRTYRLTVAPLSHFCSHRRRQSHTDAVQEHTD